MRLIALLLISLGLAACVSETYYADTDAHDLSGRESQDWYGAALAHVKLAASRKPMRR